MSFHQTIGDSVIEGDFSQLEKLVKEISKAHFVDIGVLGAKSSSLHPDSEYTIAEIGAVHEFGTLTGEPPIPQRSFIRMPLETGQKQITQEVEKGLEEKLANGNIEGIFKDIGIAAEVRIQEAFETGGFSQWEPLSERTIAAKGSSAILIDRGFLRKSITSRVGS